MKYAIELYYDKGTENELFKLSNELAEKGITSKFVEWKARPHLTLACFNDIDEKMCVERLKEFADTHNAIPAYIASVGMFNDTKTIFVSPVMNSSMYKFQHDLHNSMCGFDTRGHEWYLPDRWVPHCTIALTAEEGAEAFYQASDYVLRKFEKICGKFASIGLVKIRFPVEEIYTMELPQ